MTARHPSRFGATAQCSGTDSEAFFPEAQLSRENMAAIRICFGCTVRDECLEWALENEQHGIWGATTPKQRQAIRRRRGAFLANDEVLSEAV